MFEQLSKAEPDSFWYEARNQVILWALRLRSGPVSKYVEIGCGTGFVMSAVTQSMDAREHVGVEYYVKAIEIARRRSPRAQFIRGNALALPFGPVFDAVGAFDVIEHIDEDVRALREMARVLARDGRVVLTVPQHPWLWSEHDRIACHRRRYTRAQLFSALRSAGLEPVYATSFVCLLLPAMWLSRCLPGRKPGSLDVSIPSRPVNTLLRWVMSLEFAAIRAGLCLPFGGSLLVIARKSSDSV